MTVSIDTIIDERYLVLKHLGEGGMGSVYQVRELELDRLLAVKFLHPELLADPESRQRFQRESRVLSCLKHPSIVTFFRFGTWQEMPYIAMEYVEGRTLRDEIIDSGMPVERVLNIAVQVAEGMQHAHESGVIHRDLKPNNIFLLPDDAVKIVDFGLAKILSGLSHTAQHLTGTGNLVGSVHYMSPEACMGKAAGPKSDIYSLACIIYEAICGSPPLVADTPIALLHLHANEQPATLQSRCRNKVMPPGLDACLNNAFRERSGAALSIDESVCGRPEPGSFKSGRRRHCD